MDVENEARAGSSVGVSDLKVMGDPSLASQDQTVEEYLKVHCSQLVGDLNAHAESLIKNLQHELERGKAEIMGMVQGNTVGPTSSDAGDSGASTSTATGNVPARSVAASTGPPGSTFLTVILTVTDGPYAGTVFRLVQSKGRKEFVVGRSTGKKVKEHGASMPQDPEVSTVHGRFECRAGGKVMYEDLGSTNGSFINGACLEERVPTRVQTGDVLKVGGGKMTIEIQTRHDASQ